MRSTLAFFGQIATRWRETGALAPSSRRLARAMASCVGQVDDDAVLVELGPGTGVFTKELTRSFPANRVLAVEFNPVFVRNLQRDVPRAEIVEGCASHLPRLLAERGVAPGRVGAVLSGLPLLLMPRDLSRSILSAVAQVLEPGRPFVQFTYSERAWRRFRPEGFRPCASRRVWLNIPPAVVLPFTRAG
jgi:phosphatidylethanolamine/phosphatidyl-N-methylethanolamine N-methyltransferase